MDERSGPLNNILFTGDGGVKMERSNITDGIDPLYFSRTFQLWSCDFAHIRLHVYKKNTNRGIENVTPENLLLVMFTILRPYHVLECTNRWFSSYGDHEYPPSVEFLETILQTAGHYCWPPIKCASD